MSATVLLLVFLGALGVGLNNAFKQSVLSNAEDALKNQVLLLMANIDVDAGQIIVPPVLSEPRFAQPESSLYGQISTPNQGVVWQSDSLLDQNLPDLPGILGSFSFFEKPNWPQQPDIYAISFGAEWETERGDIPFTIQLAERTTIYTKRMARFQRQIGVWLAVTGAALLALLLTVLSWGLKPLGRVTRQVGEIEQGSRQRFDEDYPSEVNRLTQSLNQLLNFEQQRIARQKDVLGNLAHSLKTPLAVMSGLNYSNENKAEAKRQLSAMQNIIDYQLHSASAVGRRRFASPIDIRPATEQIIKSLSKLHKGKNLDAKVDIAEHVLFFGDEGDWMELVGNLLDNAFKWADSEVAIIVSNELMDSHRSATLVQVSDDGAGIDETLKATILQRGVRLDSQTPGHGLGLHIVKGIVEAYDGELLIDSRKPRGTLFKVRLN